MKRTTSQPTRQEIYLRALRTLPNISIHFGHFLTHEVTMPLVKQPGEYQNYARVVKTEEKGSDVNIATHLLHDAHMNRFDVAVVVSNDSDLLAPIKIVRYELNKRVGVLSPYKRPSNVLRSHATFIKPIRSGVLLQAQFPDKLTDHAGTFSKPKFW